MVVAIVLSLAASFCTATSSVCRRLVVCTLHFGPLALVQPLLASHAMTAGPLAASQPGFTLRASRSRGRRVGTEPPRPDYQPRSGSGSPGTRGARIQGIDEEVVVMGGDG
jgi:hypothetical protein